MDSLDERMVGFPPLANIISPLARLIDYPAARYNILFVVSAGNIPSDLLIPGFDQWADFEKATSEQRKRAVMALNATKHERSLLSPTESINALTIGFQHATSRPDRRAA